MSDNWLPCLEHPDGRRIYCECKACYRKATERGFVEVKQLPQMLAAFWVGETGKACHFG